MISMVTGKHGKTGFTLIELLLVVVVVGILAAAAGPIYRFAMKRAYGSEGKVTVGALRTAELVILVEGNPFVTGTSTDTPSILKTLAVNVASNTWWTTANATFGIGDVPNSIKAVVPPDGTYIYAIGTDGKIKGIELYLDVTNGTWYEYWP